MNDKQQNALMLADAIERYNAGVHSQVIVEGYSKAAAELRRLYEVNAELVEALSLILSTYNDGGWPTAALIVAEAALAKATGENA